MNKIAEPDEVAIQVAFLASHRVAGHTTGQVVMIHGGMEGEYFASDGVSRADDLVTLRREVVEFKAVIENLRERVMFLTSYIADKRQYMNIWRLFFYSLIPLCGIRTLFTEEIERADRHADLFIFGGPAQFRGYSPGYSTDIVDDKWLGP